MTTFLDHSRSPGAIAVIDATGSYPYGDLAARSARVAIALLAGRADLGDARVPFLVHPGFDHVATALGIWRAGGIAVPLATSHPPPELEYVLDDAAPDSVLVDTRYRSRLEPLAADRGVRLLPVDQLPSAGDASLLPAPDPARPALMIYTSGTTGRPKGVITTHANIGAQIGAMAAAWEWSSTDRIVHALPLHHVHGIVNALWSAISVGATVVFVDFDPAAIWNRFAAGDITLFMAVPTMYHRLIAEWDRADEPTRQRWSAGARRLRLMVSGSAALPVATLARWRELTGHTLLERYGMTEIGMALSNPLHGERRPGTVGQPFPNVDLRLIDERGDPVPPGTPGQVVVRGPQVFREYWGRPEATRAAFRDGWFLTGDVAVVESGYYRLLGRESVDLIKSAGYKISALEIEEVFRAHPAIIDCAVIGVPDPDLGERVAAVITLGSGPPPDPEGLRGWARERLAPYKVPRSICFVDALPRNAMGKVTKPALRDLFA